MIYIIRDQIGNPVTNNLSLAGSKNSKLFAEFLANKLDVKTIITQKPSGKITDSQLENIQVYQTASKIAIYLGFKVVCYSNMKHALQDNIEFLENPKKTILIVWNHAEIPNLLNEILNHNKVKKPAIINWDSDNYNACIGLQKTKWRFFPQVIDGFTNDDLPHHKYNQDQNNSNSDDASETDASESDEAEHTQSDADEAEHTQSDADEADASEADVSEADASEADEADEAEHTQSDADEAEHTQSDADDAEEADEAEHAEHTQSDTESDTEHVEHGQSDADEAEHAESDAEQTKKSHKKETQVADSLRQAKQVQAAGSLRQAQQTHVADSLRQAQQTHVADSLRQAQQVHVADSLRQAKQVQAKQTHVADSLRQAQQAQAQSTNEDKINTNRTKMNKQERIVLHVKSPKSLKQLQQRKNSTPKARRGQSQTAGANQERNKTKPSTNMERNKTKSSTNKTKPSTDESSESNCSIQ